MRDLGLRAAAARARGGGGAAARRRPPARSWRSGRDAAAAASPAVSGPMARPLLAPRPPPPRRRAPGPPAPDAARALRLPVGARDHRCAWCSSRCWSAPFYEQQAARQSERTINLDPRRGAILDRNGRAARGLGGRREHLRRAPGHRRPARATAAALARALGLDAAARKELQAQLQKSRAFVWVRRKVDPRHRARGARPAARRHRLPHREPPLLPAARAGLAGARLRRPRQHGHERHRVRVRGRRSAAARPRSSSTPTPAAAPSATPRSPPPTATPSCSPSTSPSSTWRRGSSSARWRRRAPSPGVAVVMDPRTGEILALANRPDLQPEPLRRLPERALAQPRGGRRLRAGQHLQDLHRRRRPAGEGGRPGRGDRLRPRLRSRSRASASTTTTSSTSSPSAT